MYWDEVSELARNVDCQQRAFACHMSPVCIRFTFGRLLLFTVIDHGALSLFSLVCGRKIFRIR